MPPFLMLRFDNILSILFWQHLTTLVRSPNVWPSFAKQDPILIGIIAIFVIPSVLDFCDEFLLLETAEFGGLDVVRLQNPHISVNNGYLSVIGFDPAEHIRSNGFFCPCGILFGPRIPLTIRPTFEF